MLFLGNEMGLWDYLGMAAMMVVSFFVANSIAWLLESSRRTRVADKTKLLSQSSKLRTPVTIVTGFLGSGKTTLVNRILSSDHGKRIVVIENEVGEISIDDKLLRADEGEKAAVGIFVMKNGCMCCSSAGSGGSTAELERVLSHLLELLQDDEYDYVVIETSGLADPAPIMQTFFSAQTAKGRFFLDGVVTMVDAKHVCMHLDGNGWGSRTTEVARQLSHATTVVVGKCDLVTDSESGAVSISGIEEIEAKIRPLCPCASILRSSMDAPVSIDSLLDQRAFHAEGVRASMSRGEGMAVGISKSARGDGGHEHSAGVSSVSVGEGDAAIDADAFHEWITGVVSAAGSEIYRIKGVLNIRDKNRIYVFQGVCGELRGTYHREWADEDDRKSELVIIGRHLDRDGLREGFLKTRALL